MVTPDKVIQKIVSLCNDNKETIGITLADEMSEDSPGKKLFPPMVYVFELLEDQSDESNSAGVPIDIPVEVPALIFSKGFESASESSAECYSIAQKILNVVPGVYQLLNTNAELENVHILVRKQPLDLISKSPASSVLKINFYYLMDFEQ